MFAKCNSLTTTITIINIPTVEVVYTSMFLDAATVERTKIKVNYTIENESLVNEMFTTVNGNVVKGDDILA